MKQFSFFKTDWKHHYTHGGELRKKRKGRSVRPLSTKEPLHAVFKINKFRLRGRSLRGYSNYFLVSQLIEFYARKFAVKIEQCSIQNDHIHLLLRTSRRSQFHFFFRVLTGQIAQRFEREGLLVAARAGVETSGSVEQDSARGRAACSGQLRGIDRGAGGVAGGGTGHVTSEAELKPGKCAGKDKKRAHTKMNADVPTRTANHFHRGSEKSDQQSRRNKAQVGEEQVKRKANVTDTPSASQQDFRGQESSRQGTKGSQEEKFHQATKNSHHEGNERQITKESLWKHRPFSRVVKGWKAYAVVRDYIQLNEKEAWGDIPYRKERLKGMSMSDWEILWG